MAVSIGTFANTINQKINSGSVSELEMCQLVAASDTLNNLKLRVNTFSALPAASTKVGLFYFVEDVGRYAYSDGLSWSYTRDYRIDEQGSYQCDAFFMGFRWFITDNGNGLGGYTTCCPFAYTSSGYSFESYCGEVPLVMGSGQRNSFYSQFGTDAEIKKIWSNCNGAYAFVKRRSQSTCKLVAILTSFTAQAALGNGGGFRGGAEVPGGFTDWIDFSYSGNYAAGIRADRTLWTWGNNFYGELGHNTGGNFTCKSSPVSIVGGFTDWCQVSAGNLHTAAIRTNGTLWTWGYNPNGQLGDETTICRSSPVSVVGGFTDWCQISAANYHTAAIRTNGTLWTWGAGPEGFLGDGTTIGRSSPVSVVGGFTDWCQVSAGDRITAAIRTNGTLWTWGSNVSGQLGAYISINTSSPVSVVGGFTDWCRVNVFNGVSAAQRTNGSLWAWGINNGAYGIGYKGSDRSSPVSVLFPLSQGSIDVISDFSVSSQTLAVTYARKYYRS